MQICVHLNNWHNFEKKKTSDFEEMKKTVIKYLIKYYIMRTIKYKNKGTVTANKIDL
jgi:hypothetical protein